MDLGLRDRAVLVTGGSAGIGAAVAREFCREGARVAITYHTNKEVAAELATELGAHSDRALATRYSLAEPGSVESAVAEVAQCWGGVDVLVANAMRWSGRRPPEVRFEQVEPTEWRSFIDDNLAPTLRTVQLTVPGMRSRGWGRIVLVSSHVVVDGQRGQEFYAATKAALHGFARSLCWEFGSADILVNVVCPGLTATRRVLDGLPEELRNREISRTPTGRLSSPEDIASAVAFLGSAANRNITGQVITVAGGR
jgi:NAD(P)-dependent dehydrogenase (short-subunit alcohol dehydrogenase family)